MAGWQDEWNIQIKVKQTRVRDLLGHPVNAYLFSGDVVTPPPVPPEPLRGDHGRRDARSDDRAVLVVVMPVYRPLLLSHLKIQG